MKKLDLSTIDRGDLPPYLTLDHWDSLHGNDVLMYIKPDGTVWVTGHAIEDRQVNLYEILSKIVNQE